MHTLLLVLITPGLVLFQTMGLTAHLEPDPDVLDDAMAEGFIVSTEERTKTETPQDNYNGIITHDSLNQEASQSQFQKDSLPTGTPEANAMLTRENTKELPKNESAAVLNTVGSRKNTASTSEENAEGSGILNEEVINLHAPVIHSTMENADAVDTESERSLNNPSLKTLNEKQDNYNLIDGSGMWPEVSSTPTPIIIEENNVEFVKTNAEAKQPLDTSNTKPEKPGKTSRKLIPERDAQAERVKEGTPGWLLILALCLTLAAVICVFVGIGTKDMWYGPTRQCLNSNSTGSNNHSEYNKAATLTLSEKERMALMSAQKKETQETDCSISLEEPPEKEYLM